MKKLLIVITLLFIGSLTFSQITLTSMVSNVSCFGGSNGSATVSSSGGTAPYTYTWMPSNMNSPTLSGLAAGAYTVTVMDAVANTSSLVVIIGQPTQLTAVTTVTHTNCGQANGATCAIISGGTGATTYSWNNGVTTQCNSGIVAGAYSLTVTDANGCVANSYSTLGDYPGPAVSISSQTNVSCFGGCNGAAMASVSGGTLPYMYNWSNGQVTASGTNLCAGSYSVAVTDNVGCVGTAYFSITQPTQLNAITNVNHVKCFGTNTGTISASGLGGTPPYTYLWPSLSSTLSVVPNVLAGNYSVNVTDANGCQTTQSVNVSQPQQMTAITSLTNASCGMCDGGISMVVWGGNPGYSFSWTPSMPGNSAIATNLCTGIYMFQATDGNNCSVTNVITILSGVNNTIPNTTVTSTSYNETCYQSFDGAIDLNISGSNPGPFTYQWSNGDTTQDLANVLSNVYWVTVTDASSNCLTLIDTVAAIGANCGTISGSVFIDSNSDCINNIGDYNFAGATLIVNPGNRVGVTNNNGIYFINNLPYGTYSLSLSTSLPGIFPSCTTTITTNINSGIPNSGSNVLTGGFNSGTQPDMKVSAYNQGIVPGFVCRMNYNLSNLNNVNGTGLFKVTLPSSFIPNIVNATPGYSVSGDTVIWAFSNIVYSIGTPYYFIDFTTPLSTPLGSTFISCMWAEPNITDFDYANNTYCYSRTVTGSFDPNDKTVSPVGIGANGYIAATETDLIYLIRFQNTGNGPAVNIMVKDTLSPNVDINSFEMLGASHNYNIDVLSGNILRWKFNNIMLADSGSNEPASHGYIQYRIKRTNNNTPGTQIKNTAYIYFDFNAPVVTNTAINTIETVTTIQSQSFSENSLNMYPNPSTGTLFIVNSATVKEESQIQVLNAMGQIVYQEIMHSNYKTIDLSKLTNGVYFVKVTSDKSSTVKRVLLSK